MPDTAIRYEFNAGPIGETYRLTAQNAQFPRFARDDNNRKSNYGYGSSEGFLLVLPSSMSVRFRPSGLGPGRPLFLAGNSFIFAGKWRLASLFGANGHLFSSASRVKSTRS